ncbi:P-loop containing nucleoside triphosphate hydrolase protein [Fusarium venenatum]|uniref:P-loop containing nucleoside triphosphate hydrolase protein n=1 Tax=Fusarium venenatum TaxID=56646 RepID=UPI001DDAB7C5|nr:P-loop containing nucleoside triphosphate hydrolase protein [Fusarium venenatum]
MDFINSNQTTAEQARILEDAEDHPLKPGVKHSANYFQLLAERRRLPVSAAHQEFLDVYHRNKFVVFDEAKRGLVACTQPRRLVAKDAATRVAAEIDITLGEEVGYSVHFDEKPSDNSILRYMTDGRLLQEAQRDQTFQAYVNTFIQDLCLLKKAIQVRDNLKVVIISATMNVERFVKYFGQAEAFNVSSKAYPVKIHWLEEPTVDWRCLTLNFVKNICNNMPVGARKQAGSAAFVLWAQRRRAAESYIFFNRPPSQMIVYVIDTGIEKKSGYNARADMDTLITATVTQASAKQQAGRAGRTKPGTCIRLYTEKTFLEDFAPYAWPGIKTSPVTTEVLRLMSMDINVVDFDFITLPPMENFLRALYELKAMDLITDHGVINGRGRNAAKFPMDPQWWNAISEGQNLGCGVDIIAITAIASTQNSMFLRPWNVRTAADASRARFACPDSDHVAQLNALHGYVRTKHTAKDMDLDQWCSDAFIDRKVMEEALQIRQQLINIAEEIFDQLLTSGTGDDDLLAIESCLVGQKYKLVVFNAITHVGKTFLETSSAVEAEWLVDLPFFKDDQLSRKLDGDLR